MLSLLPGASPIPLMEGWFVPSSSIGVNRATHATSLNFGHMISGPITTSSTTFIKFDSSPSKVALVDWQVLGHCFGPLVFFQNDSRTTKLANAQLPGRCGPSDGFLPPANKRYLP